MNVNHMTKTLLITGASGGIGAAAAILAAQNGWRVAVHYHTNHAQALNVCNTIIKNGGQAQAFKADLTIESEIEQLFKQVGDLHGLVNNVGITPLIARVDEMTAERLNTIFNTNITSAFLCAGHAIKAMSTRYGHAGGVMVNVSSRAAVLGSAHRYIDYAASKAALDTLTIGLAKELALESIRVNTVRAGMIDTPIHDKNNGKNDLARIQSTIPMQRIGTADEVAQAIVWLLSDAASYCTGTFIDVAGGR